MTTQSFCNSTLDWLHRGRVIGESLESVRGRSRSFGSGTKIIFPEYLNRRTALPDKICLVRYSDYGHDQPHVVRNSQADTDATDMLSYC